MNSHNHLPAGPPPIPLQQNRRRNDQYAPPPPSTGAVNINMPVYPPYGTHPSSYQMPMPQTHAMPQHYSPQHQQYAPPLQQPMSHPHQPQHHMYPPFYQYPHHFIPQHQPHGMHAYNHSIQPIMPLTTYPPPPPIVSSYPPHRTPSPYYQQQIHNQMQQMQMPLMPYPMEPQLDGQYSPEFVKEQKVPKVGMLPPPFEPHMEVISTQPSVQPEPEPLPESVELEPIQPEATQVTESGSPNIASPPSVASSNASIVHNQFFPQLPWISVPPEAWNVKRRARKQKTKPAQTINDFLELSTSQLASIDNTNAHHQPTTSISQSSTGTVVGKAESQVQDVPEPATPLTSQPPSEIDSTNPTTPSSAIVPSTASQNTPISKQPIRPAIPLSPVIPLFNVRKAPTESPTLSQEVQPEEEKKPEVEAVPVPVKPKSWAELLKSNDQPKAIPQVNGASPPAAPGVSRSESLAEALSTFAVGETGDSALAYLEPRGLVNTGNMCYMNAVLQILMFNTQFYNFLDVVARRTGHNFKGDTPLLDAMILFMREYKVIESATSVAELKSRLTKSQLEQYGESFTPEYVYEVIRRLPQFASMRRGHQQDAEEFLGFLLGGLHEESVKTIKTAPRPATQGTENTGADWLEVGPKQKAAITRSSGAITTESPVTKIFGGILRSELRVPGLKPSVTYEPFQPLQLDIQSAQIRNISDALKGITRPESIHGDFNSPMGPGVTATKQVYIENLPPVLILHLKRFQYDNTGGTQKIWKKVGYPLELDIPREVLSSSKRAKGVPKYRLTGVIYHHGKSAAGGHYTVDLLRQDGTEWIRLDDTVIRRVRHEEVAEAGSEDSRTESTEADSDDGWKQVSPGDTKNSWSRVANGATKSKTNAAFFSKDKVAYLLFYSRI